MYVYEGRVFKQLKVNAALYERVARWSKALLFLLWTTIQAFCGVGSNQGRPIFLYVLNYYRALHIGIHWYILCFETKKYIYMYFFFNPFVLNLRCSIALIRFARANAPLKWCNQPSKKKFLMIISAFWQLTLHVLTISFTEFSSSLPFNNCSSIFFMDS